ncbi:MULTISPECIES: methyltransferase [Nonomuraea]|uniref:Methyltransferase n=2 Tax=Nonomuraea TaxID=83681 RepID=A0ABW1BVL5_9ACTN|nr:MULTISPECIES: methyltransferase [Nonomuraea]MDA0647258.1 methyltransferase [Nonomuraea ferruginea]TXK42988.1 MarR family transcriptional regulator [Nonomuraea sp. C10]
MRHSDDLIWDAMADLSRFAALLTMAELGVADELAHGPLEPAELARRCEADPRALRRVLRELAAMGLVRRAGDDRYDLSERGTALRSDVPGSLRSSIRMLGDERLWYAMGNLPATVRSGSSALTARYGPLYESLATDPEASRIFGEYMSTRAIPFIEGLVKGYDFTGVHSLVDVGGGRGHILSAILRANPEMRGVLLDREHVVEQARQALADDGLAGRCELVPGDFFRSVPEGRDAYLLGSVLHNWDDEDAVAILRTVRQAMSPTGRVLILEIVLPDDDAPHLGKDLDMRMLAVFDGGAERSRAEYGALLARADLTLTRVVGLEAAASVIEAVPA